MTIEQCVELVRELAALERLIAVAATQRLAADEWRYGLVAFEDSARRCADGLSLADPALVLRAALILAAEAAALRPDPVPARPAADLPAWSAGGRLVLH